MAKKTHDEVSAIEAAQELRIDPGYLYLQLRAGRIAGRKVGGRWLVSLAAIEKRKLTRQRQSDATASLQR